MATLALKAGLCFLRVCFNFLLLISFLILGAVSHLNNLSSFWGPSQRVFDESHRTVQNLVKLEDRELTGRFGFPASRRELIDKLQLKVVVFDDRIEINSIFSIDPIRKQLCISTKGD